MSLISPLFVYPGLPTLSSYQAGGRSWLIRQRWLKQGSLVVDDLSLVRLYYRSALETAGFEVKQAINGIEAMEKVLSELFDLVIVDVNMPRMDGFTFLRSLRSGAADVRRASGNADDFPTEFGVQDIAEAKMLGVNFYLVKPVAEGPNWFGMFVFSREPRCERSRGTIRYRSARTHPTGYGQSYRAGTLATRCARADR